jgi:membrane peptidoglycan carboxypeptidase
MAKIQIKKMKESLKNNFTKFKNDKRKVSFIKKIINIRNIVILFIIGIIFLAVVLVYFFRDLPDIKNLGKRVSTESFTIYDRTGTVILYDQTQAENRQYLKFEELPEVIKKATMAAEDDDFYTHGPIDIKSLVRVIIENVIKVGKGAGGSTLTQQLARNAFLTTERSMIRKVREMILSFYLEKEYSKDKILEMYLNQVPYGYNAYGVESASQLYFSKNVKDLNVNEAAYLASLLQSPSYLSPFGNHRDKLEIRKNWVLSRMNRLGWLSDSDLKKYKEFKTEFKTKKQAILAPHFVSYIQAELANKYGEDLVQRGGLKIITTLDYDLQKKAEEIVKTYGDLNEKNYDIKNMALVAEDPKTGQILAMIGSRDFWNFEIDGNFNAAFGLRQPGSSFKPFVYLNAFKKGYSPDTIVFDTKTNFSTDVNSPYIPINYDKLFRGPVSLRNALAQSLNVPAVKMLYLAGVEDSIMLAKSFGINTLVDGKSQYGLSLVLGGGAVNLYEMVGAYSVLSQEGVKHKQVTILKVSDREGKVLEEYKDDSSLVFTGNQINMINDVLSDNVARTPLFHTSDNAMFFGNNVDVAAKTGTSSDSRDAWIYGYTPNIVAGLWVGNNDYSKMFKGPTGGLVAAPAWHEFMKYAISKRPVEYFEKPNYQVVNKPMFNGKYINSLGSLQAHSILFYVDKNDPLGPIPRNSGNDPQFSTWENSAIEWCRVNIAEFDASYNRPIPESAYNDYYKPVETTTTTIAGGDSNIAIEYINVQNDQIFNSDIDLRVRIISTLPMEEKTLFVNNNYFGDLQNFNDNVYGIRIPKESLVESNEIKVHVMDRDNNILEKAIRIVISGN